jgi:hypothetical protein
MNDETQMEHQIAEQIRKICDPMGPHARLGALFGTIESARDIPRDFAKDDLARIIEVYDAFQAAGGLPAFLK